MTKDAKANARFQNDGSVFVDHCSIVEEDIDWLADVERLTLWNVIVPDGFLSRLERLWWVDWRGGGKGQHIEQLADCSGLRYLCLNQIRGLDDLHFLHPLSSVEFLSIYGLAAVECLPSLSSLSNLRRLEIGQMKRLKSIHAALDAPNLEELLLIRKINVTTEDVVAINSHASLRSFDWVAEDVPDRVWMPVKEVINLPKARLMHAREWFSL